MHELLSTFRAGNRALDAASASDRTVVTVPLYLIHDRDHGRQQIIEIVNDFRRNRADRFGFARLAELCQLFCIIAVNQCSDNSRRCHHGATLRVGGGRKLGSETATARPTVLDNFMGVSFAARAAWRNGFNPCRGGRACSAAQRTSASDAASEIRNSLWTCIR